MKRLLFINLCVYITTILYAVNTTLTTSIYVNPESFTYNQPVGSLQNLATSPKRIKFMVIRDSIETTDSTNIILIKNALQYANSIFSQAMADIGVDMTEAIVDIQWANADNFSTMEICKTEVNYTDELYYNPIYPHIGDLSSEYLPILYPKALSNQSYGYNRGPIMTIMLNKDFMNEIHFDITACPEDKFDFITLILKSLAVGCGIQSSLNAKIYTCGVIINNQKYLTAYDTQIYNDVGISYEQVARNLVPLDTFLLSHDVYVQSTSPNDIYLFNELRLPNNTLSFKTLNTISAETYNELDPEGFYDLMDSDLSYGTCIRDVTHYTKSILQKLGWQWDILTGEDTDALNLYLSKLSCGSTQLYPDSQYTISVDRPLVALSNIRCELDASDSTYLIGNTQYDVFSYASIPANVQWNRNPITKNITGHIKATAFLYDDFNVREEKLLEIEIPYRPDSPIVQLTENTQSGTLSIDLRAFANGSDTYTVSYTGLIYNDSHSFMVQTDVLDTTLSIPGGQLYSMSIYGTNDEGNSDIHNITFGSSSIPPLALATMVSGNTLRYYLTNNPNTNVVVTSAIITDVFGLISLSVATTPGAPINISSLSRGYYILTVIANGQSYNSTFYKR